MPVEEIGGAVDYGAANLIYGLSAGLGTTSLADRFWRQGNPGVKDVEESNDEFSFLSSGRSITYL